MNLSILYLKDHMILNIIENYKILERINKFALNMNLCD